MFTVTLVYWSQWKTDEWETTE